MTVNSTNITSGPYVGNDLVDTYDYTFRITDKSEVAVYETDDLGEQVLLVVDTDYTVNSVGDDNGGNITRVAGVLPADYEWYIRSEYDETQLTAFESQGAFFPQLHESAMDKLTFLAQQLLDKTNRSMRYEDGYSGAASPTLPAPIAGQFVRWKGDLSGFENTELIGTDVASSGGLYIYPSVAVMTASGDDLPVGMNVRTQGYYSAGDVGGATYLVAAAQAVDGYGDHTLANGNVALLQLQAVNDVRWWGAKADFVIAASRGADTGTDSLASFDAAIAKLATVDHVPTHSGFYRGSAVLSLGGGNYGVSNTVLVPDDHHGLTIQDGLIAPLLGYVHAADKAVIQVGEGLGKQCWQIALYQLTVNARKRGNCIMFNGTQKCAATLSSASEFIEYGFATETKSGELKIDRCSSYEYPFSEAAGLTFAARTGAAFHMRTADFIMTACIGAVSKYGFILTGGYNWQCVGCHFWVGDASDTPLGNTPLFVCRSPGNSGVISNLYLDEGVIELEDSFNHIFNGVVAAQGTYGNTDAVFVLTTSTADQNARDLIVDNIRSDRFIVANTVFSYLTTGGGSWVARKAHHITNITNGGNSTSREQLARQVLITSIGSMAVYTSQDDTEAFAPIVCNMSAQFQSVGTGYSKAIAVTSFSTNTNQYPGFISASAPSGVMGDFSVLPLSGQKLGQFWATGSDGTNFGDGGQEYHGGAGMRIIARENWTGATQKTDIDFWTTGTASITPAITYVMERPRFRPSADNVRGLGSASFRWTEVFAAAGTINTSDERQKTVIGAIPDTVLDAWALVPKRQYKWIDSVAEKGAAARWHFGVIAQDVVAAFASKGLDATDYGVLCFDEWPEQVIHHEDKYSAEYNEEGEPVKILVTDEEGNPTFTTGLDFAGNEIQEPIMQDKMTKIADAYDEVIPAGEVYGVRYSEAAQLDAALIQRALAAI